MMLMMWWCYGSLSLKYVECYLSFFKLAGFLVSLSEAHFEEGVIPTSVCVHVPTGHGVHNRTVHSEVSTPA